jgi:hypothetical protein
MYLGQFGACGVEVVFGSLGAAALGVSCLGEVTGLVLKELAERAPAACRLGHRTRPFRDHAGLGNGDE